MRTTSAEAHRKNKASGYLTRRQRDVFEFMKCRLPMTGAELDQQMHDPSAHKRLAELALMGVIAERQGRDLKTGHRSLVWGITGQQPNENQLPGIPLRARPKTRKQLIDEIARYRAHFGPLPEEKPRYSPPLYFYSVPTSKVPSPYFKHISKLLADLSQKGILKFTIWTGSHEAPIPVSNE